MASFTVRLNSQVEQLETLAGQLITAKADPRITTSLLQAAKLVVNARRMLNGQAPVYEIRNSHGRRVKVCIPE